MVVPTRPGEALVRLMRLQEIQRADMEEVYEQLGGTRALLPDFPALAPRQSYVCGPQRGPCPCPGWVMERTGIEPVTFGLQSRRSPS